MKTCTKCKIEKPFDNFSPRKNRPSGFKSWCKTCESSLVIERNKANKDKWNEYQREYYKRNPDLYKQNANKRRCLVQKSLFKLNEYNQFLLEELYSLAQMRTKFTKIPWEVDHIVPIKGKFVCGLHVPWNMQVITRSENRSKSNKLTEIKF